MNLVCCTRTVIWPGLWDIGTVGHADATGLRLVATCRPLLDKKHEAALIETETRSGISGQFYIFHHKLFRLLNSVLFTLCDLPDTLK